MNELQARWIAALRSGKYQQGEWRLRSNTDRFCCLGVACDVADSAKWKLSRDETCYSFQDQSTCLPESLRNEVGLTVSLESDLITMNDRDAKSFIEIADYLERQYGRFLKS